jgi:ketosteroid isomerase-like protein
MSEENVELTNRVLAAFNRRDLDAYLALLDDEIEAVPRIVGGLGGTVRGHDGIRRWWKDLFDFIPDLTTEIVEVRDLGDRTMVHTRYHGHGATSDAPVAEVAWIALQWRTGKCVWWSSKATEAEALEAARMSE